MKIDWKAKLSSRKFWAAVVSYLTGILTACNVTDNSIVQVTGIVGGIGALIVYMLSESNVDAARKENQKDD